MKKENSIKLILRPQTARYSERNLYVTTPLRSREDATEIGKLPKAGLGLNPRKKVC